jgi:hypothetical protein
MDRHRIARVKIERIEGEQAAGNGEVVPGPGTISLSS